MVDIGLGWKYYSYFPCHKSSYLFGIVRGRVVDVVLVAGFFRSGILDWVLYCSNISLSPSIKSIHFSSCRGRNVLYYIPPLSDLIQFSKFLLPPTSGLNKDEKARFSSTFPLEGREGELACVRFQAEIPRPGRTQTNHLFSIWLISLPPPLFLQISGSSHARPSNYSSPPDLLPRIIFFGPWSGVQEQEVETIALI